MTAIHRAITHDSAIAGLIVISPALVLATVDLICRAIGVGA